ncbi:23S rRNA (adenine2503-C2)-methyltransferase [Lachnospiraceae bacterium PF1-21]|uniref:Probable dual-specificity RNA methyltransferase RlmN n=1 Tax=Ohessyouella blattaphilus TaxID=2949333 RepID=A0ABT1EGC1_9FIRM|nr:23S rRNA (adenine(2503)-C(2))-methyltransferase RlmN [Ohessyouella blattaphilus]MCP1108807.1 23S rRNA (adenine(2503)-C(2))-methyltransferase RlmN [Ohessyouella blattaphilus]MCR8562201.1 23S rRNA (adenine(2503)-C(2))-methyltransferase RlmN [Ohessyouella blattaphilus]
MDKIDILSLNLKELKREMEIINEKPFRAKQIYEWLHVHLVGDFEEMTNLSKSLRQRLVEHFYLPKMELLEEQVSQVDGTRKYLFALDDNQVIETVLMRYDYGNSVCISSQAGCRMGCTFCASTIGGLIRNLKNSEMLRQIYQVQTLIGERISNVVVMGTGEPLDNYDNLVRFITMITGGDGLNISQRNLTVSTCGLVPEMKRLADENFQITLALSLHGTTQKKREQLMPVARTSPLKSVLGACDYYYKKTGRRVTFEYSLVKGVNDTDEDARELIALLKKRPFHVNLIPVNPVRERKYEKPDAASALSFKNKLEKNAINVTIRRERGTDIDGACGQLRRHYLNKDE